MKFVQKAAPYILVMNAVLFLGAFIFDGDYEFHFLFNLVVPVICAYTAWEVEQKKARDAAQK